MSNPILVPELLELIEAADKSKLQEVAEALHPAEMANFVAALKDEDIWRFFALFPKAEAAEVFSHFELERQVDLASDANRHAMARMLEELPHDDRADLVNKLDPKIVEQILPLVARAEREDIRNLASYPEGTVGAIMSSDYAMLRPEMTVSESLQQIRMQAPSRETIYYIYVVDAQHRLIGFVSLKDLILAKPTELVSDVMYREVIYAVANGDQMSAAHQIEKYDLLALPVIDENQRLAGIVTVDDIIDVQEAEATEDFHRIGGTDLADVNLKEASLGLMYRARLPWLLALVFVNVFSGAGIEHFQNVIADTAMLSVLVTFLPLLIDSGGNAGSQASTLMVRALAVGDVRMRDWFGLLRKEVVISLLLGVTMAAGAMAIAGWRAANIVVPVGLAMVSIVLFGSLIGMSLPFLLTRLKMDPATASSPLITTLADIGGVFIYYGIAAWWINRALPVAGA